MVVGQAPYQADEEINLTIDNFASAGGLLRGIFEYVYSSMLESDFRVIKSWQLMYYSKRHNSDSNTPFE